MLPIECLTEAKDKSPGSCVELTCDLHGTTISLSHICKPEDPWEPPPQATLITLPDNDMLESSFNTPPSDRCLHCVHMCASVGSNLHALITPRFLSLCGNIKWNKQRLSEKQQVKPVFEWHRPGRGYRAGEVGSDRSSRGGDTLSLRLLCHAVKQSPILPLLLPRLVKWKQ